MNTAENDYRIIINTGSVTIDKSVDTNIVWDASSGLQSYLSASIAVVLAIGKEKKSIFLFIEVVG